MASVTVVLSGDDAKLAAAHNRLFAQQEKALANYQKTLEKAKLAQSHVVKHNETETQGIRASLKAWAEKGGAIGNVTTKIGAVVGSYTTMAGFMAAITQNVADQVELQKESLRLVTELGKAQAGAAKNLTGLSPQEKAAALSAARQIQGETGFADEGALARSIGDSVSAGANVEQAIAATRGAAFLSVNEPEKLQATASGLVDLARGSGLTDERQLASLLLSSGANSRITDSAKLSQNFAPVVGNTMMGLNQEGLDKTEATKQILAITSALNRSANDLEGSSTKSNLITFFQKLDEYFDENKLAAQMPFERLEYLRQNPQARAKFQETEFGEAAFKEGFKQILNNSSEVSKAAEDNIKSITTDVKTFFQAVAETQTLTPELRASFLQNRSAAFLNAAKTEANASVVATIADTRDQLLKMNRRGSAGAVIDVKEEEIMQKFGFGRLGTVQEATIYATSQIEKQIDDLRSVRGQSGNDAASTDLKISRLEQGMALLLEMGSSFVNASSTNTRMVELMQQQNGLVADQTAAIKAGNTTPIAPAARAQSQRTD